MFPFSVVTCAVVPCVIANRFTKSCGFFGGFFWQVVREKYSEVYFQ